MRRKGQAVPGVIATLGIALIVIAQFTDSSILAKTGIVLAIFGLVLFKLLSE